MYKTVQEALEQGSEAFEEADLFFGHGTDNAWDEAVSLLIYALDFPPNVDNSVLSRPLTEEESEKIDLLFKARIQTKKPAAYLTGQMWFCGLPFYVEENVIIPRSPIAELIEKKCRPYLKKDPATILDLCTGGGCIAIAAAHYFPKATVWGSDISAEALALAKKNSDRHALSSRITWVDSNLFEKIPPVKFDLILCNPPYVDAEDMNNLPDEFRHEPTLALAAGIDGLDIVRKIFSQISHYLSSDGLLILEVGNSMEALKKAYEKLPMEWVELQKGGIGVCVIRAKDLQEWEKNR
jgi:ribosomal protein L3 glutamine methyltransferase